MRIVFMGSSAASVKCLRALMRESEFDIVGIVTQPDRPAGRGKALKPCPCKAFALVHGLTNIITPENVNSDEAMSQLRQWKPDVIVVVSFGQFLKKPLLDLPLFGCINCHFSLLPKYRGAAPVAAAIAAGDRITGVTIMHMGLGMDDGPIMLQSYGPIYSDVTSGGLMGGLSVSGGVTLARGLKLLNRNAVRPEMPQNDEDATYVHKLKKTDGLVDWNSPVIEIDRKIRAYNPWPGSYTFMPQRFRRKGNSGRIVILRSAIIGKMEEEWKNAAPGTILKIVSTKPKDGSFEFTGPIVKCLDTALQLIEIKPEGGSAMDGGAFLRGRPLVAGDMMLSQ